MDIKFYPYLSEKKDSSPMAYFHDIKQFAASTNQFRYWVVWPQPVDGLQSVHYINESLVGSVEIAGEEESKDGEVS